MSAVSLTIEFAHHHLGPGELPGEFAHHHLGPGFDVLLPPLQEDLDGLELAIPCSNVEHGGPKLKYTDKK